jgi:Holliday junction resolvase-like predicted endonuclease
METGEMMTYTHYDMRTILSYLNGKCSRKAVGAWGEILIQKLLHEKGKRVKMVNPGLSLGDLCIVDETGEILQRIEVKTARQGKDKKWRFVLEKSKHTTIQNVDVVMLVVVDRYFPYIYAIPTEKLVGKRQVCITSHPTRYAGRYREYITTWGNQWTS